MFSPWIILYYIIYYFITFCKYKYTPFINNINKLWEVILKVIGIGILGAKDIPWRSQKFENNTFFKKILHLGQVGPG